MIPPWLVSDFLSWLWFLSEQGQPLTYNEGELDVIVDGSLGLRINDDASTKASFRGNIGTDAKRSFAIGKSVSEVAVLFRYSSRDYEVRFTTKGGLSALKVKLPIEAMSSAEDIEAGVHENMLVLDEVEGIVDHLFQEYLQRRVQDSEKLLSQIKTLEYDGTDQGGSFESEENEDSL